MYFQGTGFSGCLPPPIRQNFSPTLGSLFNELLQGLTIGRIKVLMTDEISKLVEARDFVQDVDEVLEYHDEAFGLVLEYGPVNQSLDAAYRAIGMVSPDIFIKPGAVVSNLGNVRLTC